MCDSSKINFVINRDVTLLDGQNAEKIEWVDKRGEDGWIRSGKFDFYIKLYFDIEEFQKIFCSIKY